MSRRVGRGNTPGIADGTPDHGVGVAHRTSVRYSSPVRVPEQSRCNCSGRNVRAGVRRASRRSSRWCGRRSCAHSTRRAHCPFLRKQVAGGRGSSRTVDARIQGQRAAARNRPGTGHQDNVTRRQGDVDRQDPGDHRGGSPAARRSRRPTGAHRGPRRRRLRLHTVDATAADVAAQSDLPPPNSPMQHRATPPALPQPTSPRAEVEVVLGPDGEPLADWEIELIKSGEVHSHRSRRVARRSRRKSASSTTSTGCRRRRRRGRGRRREPQQPPPSSSPQQGSRRRSAGRRPGAYRVAPDRADEPATADQHGAGQRRRATSTCATRATASCGSTATSPVATTPTSRSS